MGKLGIIFIIVEFRLFEKGLQMERSLLGSMKMLKIVIGNFQKVLRLKNG